MGRTTIRERFSSGGSRLLLALACLLFPVVASAHAEPVWHVVEEGCYARQEEALEAFARLGSAVPGDLAASLRVERLDAWFCVRLGAERTEAAVREILRDNRLTLPKAVVVEAKALPERVVAGMTPGMDHPLAPVAPPPSRTAATEAEPLAGAAEPASGDIAAAPPPLIDTAEVVEISPAVVDVPDAVSPVTTVAEVLAQATVAEEPLSPASPLVPRAQDLPVIPAALEIPETGVPGMILAQAQGDASENPSPAGRTGQGGQDKTPDIAGGGVAERYAGMLWMAIKIAAVLLVLGIGLAVWRRRRNAPSSTSATNGNGQAGIDRFAEPGGQPRLSDADERRLQENLSELAMVQSNILSAQNGSTIKSIYVTSCANEEGKTTAAINMAHGLSINKNRVLLVDGNPRAPMLHKRYHAELSPGLAGWLAGSDEAREGLVRPTFYPHLSLVTFGANTLGRPNLLAENSLSRFLREYADDFDYIIMDGHSMTGSDTGMVASIFDAVVIVAQCEKTKWEVVKQAAQKMTLMGGKVLGVVLNRRKYYIPDFLYKAL